MPLAWAHAEYLKLVRSAADGQVFDMVPEVVDRYRKRRTDKPLEVWKFNRQVKSVSPGVTLRIQASAPFLLHWTRDEWQRTNDNRSKPTGVGKEFVDIPVSKGQRAPIRFTFFWTAPERWEGRDFQVAVQQTKGLL
jgi:glucoamylase